MKCIKCNTFYHETSLKEKQRCNRCGHPFVFPANQIPIRATVFLSDYFFREIIRAIISSEITSGRIKTFFTQKQFTYFFNENCRRISYSSELITELMMSLFLLLTILVCFFISLPFFATTVTFLQTSPFSLFLPLFIIFVFFGISFDGVQYQSIKQRKVAAIAFLIFVNIIILISLIFAISIKSYLSFNLVVLVGMASLYKGVISLRHIFDPQELSKKPSEIDHWLQEWTKTNGKIDQLLIPTDEEISFQKINFTNFNKVIICDNDSITQFLIANSFHISENCAILSINGYPHHIFDSTLAKIKSSDNVIIYALHDASVKGLKLINLISKNSNWFYDHQSITIYDLGLNPAQVMKNNYCFIANSKEFAEEFITLSEDITYKLMSQEFNWLKKGNYVELESFSPEELLTIISLGIKKTTLPINYQNQQITPSDVDDTYTGKMIIYNVNNFLDDFKPFQIYVKYQDIMPPSSD